MHITLIVFFYLTQGLLIAICMAVIMSAISVYLIYKLK